MHETATSTATILAALALAAGSSAAQCGDETFKLLASDWGWAYQVGFSVGASGSTGIVGAIEEDDASDAGAAYLYDLVTGVETAKLLASDREDHDRFGYSTSVCGDTAIIGAPGRDEVANGSGAAYLFEVSSGSEIRKLLPSDGAYNDGFGRSVAISGTKAVVGVSHDDDLGDRSGSAYLFDTVTGAQIAKLLASDGAAMDFFGVSVSISGDTVIVGAFGNDDSGENSGSAYLFDATTGVELMKLVPGDGEPGGSFGRSVAISDTTAIVGAPGAWGQNMAGSAYLFDASTGAQIAKLTPPDGSGDDEFGASVALNGSFAVVGALGDDDLGSGSGSIYVYDSMTGALISKLLPSDGAAGDWFGKSVAVSGNSVLVGAHGHYYGTGAAYLFCASCPGTNYCAASLNSTGESASIAACGSSSLGRNDFTLTAQPVPDEPYIFFHADNQIQTPFGNGFLCAGGNIQRLNPPATAVGNVATRVIDLPTEIGVVGTRNFQCWFRDPAGGGAAFNTSDGLEVVFTP